MAQDFGQCLSNLAAIVQRSAEIQQNSLNTSTPQQRTDKKKELKPLPSHYLFSGTPDESFIDHLEKLKALKCLQNLDNDEYIRTIKCSLTSQALRVASAIDEEEFLSKRYGSRDYIEQLEKLFVSAQQNRTFRLDFANLKQKKQDSILEFYSNLLYLAKSAKMINVNNNTNCKDRFIDGLKSTYIKRKLLEEESDDQSLNDLMTKAVNLESIEKNLPRQTTTLSSTSHSSQVEPMEIGAISPYQPRNFRQDFRQGARPANTFSSPRRSWYNPQRSSPRPPMQTTGYGQTAPAFARRPWYNQARPQAFTRFHNYNNNPYNSYATQQTSWRPRTPTYREGGRPPPPRTTAYDNNNGRTYHPNKFKDKREDGKRVQYSLQHIEGADKDTEQDHDTATNAHQYDDEMEQAYDDYRYGYPYDDPYDLEYHQEEYLDEPDQHYQPLHQQEQHFL